MKPPLCYIIILLVLAATLSPRWATAQTTTPLEAPSATDSLSQIKLNKLIWQINEEISHNERHSLDVGTLNLHTYTYGTSHCQHQGPIGKFFNHVLPFQCSTGRDLAFEAYCDTKYQWPGEMNLNTVKLQSNNRRKGLKVMRELYKIMIPFYGLARIDDEGSKKSFVLPCFDRGVKLYNYQFCPIPDSLLIDLEQYGLETDTTHLCAIQFSPKRHHHTMMEGRLVVDSVRKQVLALESSGRLDLAHFSGRFFFAPIPSANRGIAPYVSDIDIDYRYLTTRSRNNYHTHYNYKTYVPLDSLDRSSIPLDLTYFYTDDPELTDSISTKRSLQLPAYVDSLIYRPQPTTGKPGKQRNETLELLGDFGEKLVDGVRLESENSRLRINGPLDPASLGYDKFNGFTLRERARVNFSFRDGRWLNMRAEVGYAFGLREWRGALFAQHNYLPERRGRFTFEARRNNSTFSSRFIQSINEALKNDASKTTFDSIGITYYQRYDIELRHSIELANGLMLHTGVDYICRLPVKHGVRKVIDQRRQQLIQNRYADFAPYLRLEYTPHQYYIYNRGYKEYISSPSPTFALELTRAIPGFMGSDANYGRAELDVQQLIRLSRTHSLAYHLGVGKFFNRQGEYFINYRYFARSLYPERWEDDRIGGTFHLLHDYWYSSSPSYFQSHIMHETPFGLINHIRPISRYVIKERLYWGLLKAEGKNLFNEFGYGIDNNYFNVGVFVGFQDVHYYGCGIKFRIEIANHL